MHSKRFRGALLGVVALLAMIFAAGGFVISAPTADAATATVDTGTPTNRFTPNVVTIHTGDTVTFNWSAGTHIIDLMDVSPDLTIDSSHTTGTTNTFNTPGTYYYYCSIHADASEATEAHVQANDAMVGKIVVVAANATVTATTPAATATTPAATATATNTPTNAPCVLTVADQTVAPNTKAVLIAKSQQAQSGYVVIHENASSGGPGAVIGTTGLLPGGSVNTNLSVPLTRALKDGEKLWPMLHTENNGNQTYDSASVDLPTVDASCGNSAVGNVVTFPLTVHVSATAPAAPSTGSGATSSSSSNTPLFILFGGLALCVAAAAGTTYAIRRR